MQDEQLEVRDLLKLLWRRRWLIAFLVATSAGSALFVSSQMRPQYEAKANVFVGPRSVASGDAAGAIQELTFSREFVASYAEILKRRPLAERVVDKTNAPITGVELAENVDTKIIAETRLIEVSVRDHSPRQAQLYANEIVKAFVEDPNNQFGGGGGRAASVFEPALLPARPVSPKPVQNGLIGGFLGIMLGVGLSFLLERLDTAIRSKEDAERALAPLPVIGQIPMNTGRASGVFVHDDPSSPQAEAMRIIRTNVQFVSVDKPIKTVLVTSPFPEEGKTTVAVNLAASMGAVGSKVLLVETDLRKPVLHEVLSVKPAIGLSNVLAGQADVERAVQKTRISNLSILTAGDTPPNPSELLASERMPSVIEKLKTMADIVILDTPPALPVTDASVLAPHVDGVVLVVRAGRTPANRAGDVVDSFLRHDVPILGVVINALNRNKEESSYYSYRYYRRGRSRKDGSGQRPNQRSDFKESEFLDAPRGPSSRLSAVEPEPPDSHSSADTDRSLEQVDFEAIVAANAVNGESEMNGSAGRDSRQSEGQPQ